MEYHFPCSERKHVLPDYWYKKESCSQDSPPEAGRFYDIVHYRRSAIHAERFFIA